jgi:hypothetical protein
VGRDGRGQVTVTVPALYDGQRTTAGDEQRHRALLPPLQQFYKTRCGFDSLTSAQRELILFLVVYLFTQRDRDGKAPIETILPEAARMPCIG